MFAKTLLLALAASPLVAAHGKIAVMTGDVGGNTTGIGIQGGVVPGAGPNSKTEVDTTIFRSTRIMTDGLGRTRGQGQNAVAMVRQAMALSGSTLPQVSADNGSLSGVYHIVTTDGAGPVQAVLDMTGTGSFADGTPMEVTTQVPGRFGEILPNGHVIRALRGAGLYKRALNVNKDYPVAVAVPAGTTCTGTINGIQNVCLAKIANSHPAGPFGGVFAFQMASASSSGTASTSTANSTSTVENIEQTTGKRDGTPSGKGSVRLSA